MSSINTTRLGPHGTVYRCVLLRRAYRQGDQVNNRLSATLSHCTPQAIEAWCLALHSKDARAVWGSVRTAGAWQAGPSVGAGCTIYPVARQLGLAKALGTDGAGQ